MASPRPNIIYLHSHDTGRYIQPYGHAIPAPNTQRLAEAGVLFRNAHCASPSCSPSRAALLTGQASHSAGMVALTHRGGRLNDHSQHLVHTLRETGYYSVLAGFQHLDPDPATLGFDDVITPEESTFARDVAPVVVSFLSNAPEEPFFLDVGFYKCHRDFPSAPADEARYVCPPDPIPDTPRTRQDMADYVAMMRDMDEGVGRVLDAVDANGLADNTIVIQTTDHGRPHPGMKCSLTDHGTGVMLIVGGPHGFSGGRVLDSLLSQIDLFPTLCDLLEISPPTWLQGKSIMPLVRGETDEINDAVFAELNYHAAYEPQRSVRTRRYKYIRRYIDYDRTVLPNVDDGPSKDVLVEAGLKKLRPDPEQLYDLFFDSLERNNLADRKEMKLVLDEMRGRLDDWLQRTDDPLLHGPVPAPPGARLSHPHQDSARDSW